MHVVKCLLFFLKKRTTVNTFLKVFVCFYFLQKFPQWNSKSMGATLRPSGAGREGSEDSGVFDLALSPGPKWRGEKSSGSEI